ncbi:hypothetical protein ACWC1C_26115 [Streptomyces sp. NPDC001705]
MAVRLLRRADFEALERYRSFDVPWTVECVRCAATLRVRLSDVVLQRATCRDCPAVTERVHRAWADLLKNPSGSLSLQVIQALRTCTVLQARLQRHQLDVPLLVPDEFTSALLQSVNWQPELHAALRPRLRRPFHLDVLFVYGYDTMPSYRDGQRHHGLSQDAETPTGTHKGANRPGASAAVAHHLALRPEPGHATASCPDAAEEQGAESRRLLEVPAVAGQGTPGKPDLPPAPTNSGP